MPSGIYKRTKKHRRITSKGVRKFYEENLVSDKTKEKISIKARKRLEDPKEREKISKRMIGNKNLLGYEFSDPQRLYLSKKMIGNRNAVGHKVSDLQIEKLLENCYGIKCHSDDGLFFPSLQERDCYYWARDDVDEVMGIEHNFLDRIDFLLILWSGEEVALEYHPKYSVDKKSVKQYYKERRRLLDESEYKDLKLIVMTSLSNKEKKRVKREIKGWRIK